MDISRAVSEAWKVWIALGGLGLAALWTFLPRRLAPALLVGLVVVSGANYVRLGPKVPFERVDTYDFIHYYLNAKYYDQLGYFDLYPACILADHENYGPFYKEGGRYMPRTRAGTTSSPSPTRWSGVGGSRNTSSPPRPGRRSRRTSSTCSGACRASPTTCGGS